MSRDWDQPHEPTPEQLAAYLDGALTGPARAAVESWLAENPDAGNRDAAFVDHEDELTRAWQSTQPAEPSPDAWASVLGRISGTVPPSAVLPARRRVGLILGISSAAAAVVALVLAWALWPTPTHSIKLVPDNFVILPPAKRPGSGSEESEIEREKEPFAVISSAKLRIISMEGDDTHVDIDGELVQSLVVGELPVADKMLLPTSAEKLRRVGKGDPEMHYKDWGVPMFIDPIVLDKDWQP